MGPSPLPQGPSPVRPRPRPECAYSLHFPAEVWVGPRCWAGADAGGRARGLGVPRGSGLRPGGPGSAARGRRHPLGHRPARGCLLSGRRAQGVGWARASPPPPPRFSVAPLPAWSPPTSRRRCPRCASCWPLGLPQRPNPGALAWLEPSGNCAGPPPLVESFIPSPRGADAGGQAGLRAGLGPIRDRDKYPPLPISWSRAGAGGDKSTGRTSGTPVEATRRC